MSLSDALRLLDAGLAAVLVLAILARYTHPRHRPAERYHWLIICSWGGYALAGLLADLTRLGQPLSLSLPLRLLATCGGLAALALARRDQDPRP